MDEARRFLRYVMPGLSFIVQMVLFLWLLIPTWTQDNVLHPIVNSGIGLATILLFGSGGIGFIFGVIHHHVHAHFGSVDQAGTVNRLRGRNIIRLIDTESGNEFNNGYRITRLNAWIIVTAIWHERIKTNKKIKSANTRTDSLADMTHSTGTARVASVCAWLLTLGIAMNTFQISFKGVDILHFVIMNMIAFMLMTVFHCAYKRTGASVERVVEGVLFDALVDERRISKDAVEIYVAPG